MAIVLCETDMGRGEIAITILVGNNNDLIAYEPPKDASVGVRSSRDCSAEEITKIKNNCANLDYVYLGAEVVDSEAKE